MPFHGLSGYKAPKGELQRLGIRNCSSISNKLTKTSFFTDEAKKKEYIPAPTKYKTKNLWTHGDGLGGGGRPKG
jgi:hypothetical protein